AGAGKVEVGEKPIGHLELVARADEEGGVGRKAFGWGAEVSPGFDSTEGGGADGDDVAPCPFGGGDGGGGFRWEHGVFGVENAGLELFLGGVEERACADMECDVGGFDALVFKFGKDFGREVEACGRGG